MANGADSDALPEGSAPRLLPGELPAAADPLPPEPPMEGAGPSDAARGRRRRFQLTAVAVVLVLVLGVALAAATKLGRHIVPPASPEPTVSYTALTPVGPGVAMDLSRGQLAPAGLVGNRAFVGAVSGGHLQISAIDVQTGRPVWSTVDPGGFTDWQGMVPTGPMLSVLTKSNMMLVLDPDNGHVLWQRKDGLILFSYPAVSVQPSEVDGAVEGLDWRTGQPLWRVFYPIAQHWDLSQNSASSHFVRADSGLLGIDPADHRLMAVDKYGTLRIFDVTDGRLLQIVPGVGTTGFHQTIDNVLYTFGRAGVERFDLATGRLQAPFYPPPPGREISSVDPCGATLVCIVTTGDGPNQLVAVDAASGATRWSAPVGSSFGALTVGDRILTDHGYLFDLAGHQLHEPSSDLTEAGWLTAGSVLEVIREPGGDGRVLVVSTVDGKARELGRVPGLSSYCGLGATTLVCPTADGFHLYRFAT
jgi:outer membrane protein assembly factor BamB